jgi:hypothetical protein
MLMTLDECKTLMKIDLTDTTKDDFITTELEILEDYICEYTNNMFLDEDNDRIIVDDFDFINEGSVYKIKSSSDFILNKFLVGNQIRVQNSLSNDGVYKITNVTQHELTIEQPLESEENFNVPIIIGVIKYPRGLKLLVSEMISFDLLDKTIKSETISRHSITYQDLKSSYPDFIIKKLSGYARVGW